MPVTQLEEQRDLYIMTASMTDDMAAADAVATIDSIDRADEFGDWYYSENWTAEDREQVDKLQEASTAASTALIEAEQAAIERARIRLGGDKPPADASD